MALADFATGAQGALQQLLARRLEAQRYADKLQQQGFDNSLETRRLGALEEQNAFNRRRMEQADADLRQSRLATQAEGLGDQLPPETFLPETDPAVATMQQGGRGALLTPTPATEPMGADFTGPMPGGETPQQAQVGRSKGFLKTASAAQIKAQQDAADKRADNERAETQAEETRRHNREVERIGMTNATKPPASSTSKLWVTRNGKTLRVTEDEVMPGDTPVASASERMDALKFSKARPVMRAVGELSERINVNRGIEATAKGAIERQRAKVNLNDDIAEYESIIQGFTPLVARALGHSGVLTQQDVDSVRMLFPAPEDSKSVRDRKVNRLEAIFAELEGSGVQPSGATDGQGGAGGAASPEYDFVPGKGLVPRAK